MADKPAQIPSTTPAQAPDYSFDTAKLKTTTGTQEELDRFKKELSIDEAKKDGEHKEVIKIQEFFEKNKEKIKKITQAELLQLKADIQDTNQDLPGELVVDQNGVVEYKEAQAQATVAPETPANTTPAVIEKTLGELNISAAVPPLPNDYVSYNKPKAFETFIMNFLDRIGLGFIANWLKMRTMGYKSEKQMEYTQKAMNALLSVKESPISSIIRLDDITEREFRQILSDHGDLDLSVVENVEAALLGKYPKDQKYRKYHRIYRGIEVMAREISNTVAAEYKPVERLNKLLDSSKDAELDPDYSESAPIPVHVEAPIPTNIETITEKIAQETEEIAKEAEKTADDYGKTATTDGKKTLKGIAEEKLKTAKDKQIAAIAENKKIQDEYASKPNDKIPAENARKGEESIKKINELVKRVENALKKIETQGANELPPLSHTDPDNVLYKNGKLYQRDAKTPGNFREMIYKDNMLQLSPSAFFGSGTSNSELIGKTGEQVEKAGYRILPYVEASTILKTLTEAQRGEIKGGWLYIEPEIEHEHFAGKLRNIKTD